MVSVSVEKSHQKMQLPILVVLFFHRCKDGGGEIFL